MVTVGLLVGYAEYAIDSQLLFEAGVLKGVNAA